MPLQNPTPRERLLATLRGEKTDRAPVSPFVQDEYLAWYYPDKPSVDRVTDAKELADELDFDLIAKPKCYEKPHYLRVSQPGWTVKREVRREGDLLVDLLEITTPGGVLREESVGPDAGSASSGIHKAVRKHLLDTEEARDLFFEHVPSPSEDILRDLRRQAETWRAVMGERGVLAPWGPGGVFNLACDLCGIEELVMAPYDDDDDYAEFMSRLTDSILEEAWALAASGVECVGIQGNMANAAVMSPDFFHEHVQPYEQRFIDTIHAEGAFTVYHNCGQARRFYPLYREMGMTVWETVSPPPQGDNDLAEAKAAVGDRLCLLGNLDQIDFLKTATPAEVARATRRLLEIGSPGGRYIFSTSDFLERNTPLENVRAMIDTARKGL